MNNYKIIEHSNNNVPCNDFDKVTLHENILDTLFKHKKEIHKQLINVRGTFLIDHIALKIIDPDNKIVIFSITPSVEYNLIIHELWKHDKSFYPRPKQYNSLILWEEAYSKNYFNEIKYIKETKHDFSCGMYLVRKIDKFHLIYSYATRTKNKELSQYYSDHVDQLLNVGDYAYNRISDIYSNYCNPSYNVPFIADKNSYQSFPILKLIVNNKIKENQ